MNAPSNLTSAERGAYSAGFDRAARAYLRKHGSPGMAAAVAGEWTAEDSRKLRAHSQSWHATHDATRAAKCHAGGMSAVRKLHRDIVTRAETYRALTIIDPAHAAELERQADAAAARLAELEPAAPIKSTRTRATVVAAVPVDRPEAAELAKLRRGSKLEPCTRHAGYWSSLPPARRFATAVEGGTSTPCEGGACTLTPGTDRYAVDLVRRGSVTLAELNGYASREPAAELEPAPAAELEPVACAEWSQGCADVADTGTCEHGPAVADVVPLRPDVDTTPAPDTVPAPMPAMTRAARKQTRREIAAAMRAEGLRPEGEEWRRRCAAAGLPVPVLEETAR